MWQPIETADKTIRVGNRSNHIIGCDDKGDIHYTFWQEDKVKGAGWLISDTDRLYIWEPVLWVEAPEPYKEARRAKGWPEL